MEWREKPLAESSSALSEAQRWMEAVTKKKFGSSSFRSSLENGVLLCDLVNKLKPGIIKKLNRLSTPIAGLDNVNIFLKACARLGLKEAQLFHPGDLQDLSTRVTIKHQESSRRLKNVLITIYWLGRKAQADPLYNGPHLNLKAFQGLIGTALHKTSEDCLSAPGSDRDSGFGHSWYSDRQELFPLPGRHEREDSLDSLDSLCSRTLSTSSDTTLKGSIEGCGSDPEAELGFRMSEKYRRTQVVAPKVAGQFNQFLPSKDKASGYMPAPLRRKRGERNDDNRRSWASPMYTDEDGAFTRHRGEQTDSGPSPVSAADALSSVPAAHRSWVSEYESSDSDSDRPDPDLVLDDLANRRFYSYSPVAPPNFALPVDSMEFTPAGRTPGPQVVVTNVPRRTLTTLSGEFWPPQTPVGRPDGTDVCLFDDSEDEEEEDEAGRADPVHDDLYTRKVGLMPQPPARMSYNKFLPKFWTPEEDDRVQKIKKGSVRRPWYRKIQGFSRRSPGSSSEDSDSDASPWLCASSCSRSPSDPPPPPPHTPDASGRTCPPTTPSPPAQPLAAVQQSSATPRFESLVFWPRSDPASGPKLIKCERCPLRGREHPLDPYNVSADILPDLENDDMFARRTAAFHTSAELAWLKYGDLLPSHRHPESCVRVVTQKRVGQPVYPDIERDDVLYRRVQRQSVERPPSGAPDSYHPVPVPEPWALPPQLQAKLHCAPCCPEWEEPKESRNQREKEHPKEDDMLVRKLRAVPAQGVQKPAGVCQSLGRSQTGPVVPPTHSEEDLQKWQAIREASVLRYKKRLMVERLLQKGSGSDGTKSMSDILTEQNELKKVHFEELQKIRAQVKDNDDKWQDDLTKWKNRRRSINSDIVKKKEEREQIENLTTGSSTRRTKTFKEMEEEREGREPGSYKSRFSRFSTSEDQDVFEELTPKARTLPSRSYTIDYPYTQSEHPAVPSAASQREEEPSSPETDEVDPPLSPPPSSSDMTILSQRSQSTTSSGRSLPDNPAVVTGNNRPAEPTHSWSSRPTAEPSSQLKPAVSPVLRPTQPDGKPQEYQSSALSKTDSGDRKQAAVAQVSASLPRMYQRSDSARLTTVVTPRPFGLQTTRLSSLPRVPMVNDSNKRFNGEMDRTASPSQSTALTKESKASSLGSSVHSSDEELEGRELAAPAVKATSSAPQVSHVSPQPKMGIPVSSMQEENYSDMRISLNQKPHSSRDFGFQTSWDSTGAHVKSIQPGSPAELCHLQMGDEILAVNGHKVADMSYEQWNGKMNEALQQGSLFMDIRRYGKNSSSVTYNSTNLDFTSHPATNAAVKALDGSSQPAKDLPSNGVNGGIQKPVTLRNKESDPISLKNLKRRSEFFEQGGAETATLDVPVPPLSTSSNRWSWDPEEERRRQEKWQKEQERLLQEKYRRDQEKMEEEFRKAQQVAAQEGTKRLEEMMRRLDLDAQSQDKQEASRVTLQEQEDKRRREQENHHVEEERRKREQQEHLEEEKRKREQQKRLEEERKKRDDVERQLKEAQRRREEEAQRLQRKREEEDRMRQEAQKRLQEIDMDNGYTNIFPELSYSHRVKSKSTPDLDEMEKTDIKGVYSRHRGLASWLLEEELRRKKDPHIQRQHAASELELERKSILSAMRYRNPERVVSGGLAEGSLNKDNQKKKELSSQAELDRQQIIQEMKKKTQLLTDSSWIRQNSTVPSTSNEPISVPMRRGESLDNLDMRSPSWRASWAPSSTSSIPDYSRPHSALSGSAYRGGRPGSATLPASQSLNSIRQAWSQPNQTPNTSTVPESQAASRNRSVSGKKICTFCDLPLGKGAAMIIESLGLCFHLPCFKCIECKCDLGGSHAGAEVRIRNKQLYCNSCYIRFKNGQPTAM